MSNTSPDSAASRDELIREIATNFASAIDMAVEQDPGDGHMMNSLSITTMMLLGPAVLAEVCRAVVAANPNHVGYFKYLTVVCECLASGGSVGILSVALVVIARRQGRKASPLAEQIAAEECFRIARRDWMGDHTARQGPVTMAFGAMQMVPALGDGETELLLFDTGYRWVLEEGSRLVQQALHIAETEYLDVTRAENNQVLHIDLKDPWLSMSKQAMEEMAAQAREADQEA